MIPEILENACPSIQYRVRREILHEPPGSECMHALQCQIEEDPAVQEIFGWQQPDGWLGWDFHGSRGTEAGIRWLCEKGLDAGHPVLARALQALEDHPERLSRGIGKVGRILDQNWLGGSQLIRAAVLAYAGVEDRPFVQEQIQVGLDGFRAVLEVAAPEDLYELYRGKRVFRPGVRWPSIYHLRLLAWTQSWRTAENEGLLVEAIQRLVGWSPLPAIYARYRSQIVAPASFCMDDFNADLPGLDSVGWMMWFHRMELLARLGVVPKVVELGRQAGELAEMLAADGGRFTRALASPYFRHWGAYTGLMLEKDWKDARRRVYDLTFRSELIVHYSET